MEIPRPHRKHNCTEDGLEPFRLIVHLVAHPVGVVGASTACWLKRELCPQTLEKAVDCLYCLWEAFNFNLFMNLLNISLSLLPTLQDIGSIGVENGVSVSKSEKCTLRTMWRTDLEVTKLTEETRDLLIS